MPTNQPDELELRATRTAFDAVIASVHQITVLAAAGEPIAPPVQEMLWRFAGTLTDALATVEGVTPREISERAFGWAKDDEFWRTETLPKLQAWGRALRESDAPRRLSPAGLDPKRRAPARLPRAR